MSRLPPPAGRAGTTYRILLVCLGNICRSPMAEVVLDARVRAAGLGDRVAVESAGTGGWHVGGPMDERAAAALTAAGYDASRHLARQLDPSWFDRVEGFDAVLVMDSANRADVAAMRPEDDGRLLMFRDLDPLASSDDRDVPDPYYGEDDGFERVLAIIERTVDAIVEDLAQVASTRRVG